MKRNQWIAGGGVFFLLISIIAGLLLLRRELQTRQAEVSQREPLQRLAYCDTSQVTPCLVSFSRLSDDRMLVNVLTGDPLFPDFYLKIRHSDGESIYPCEAVQGFSTSVYCTGKILALGEELQFFLLSTDDNSLLAQGNFPIIGMALATVDIFVSAPMGTPSTSTTQAGILTPTRGISTPTPPAQLTPTITGTPTATRPPSYPNPSTPTVSYPKPKP